LGYSSGQSQRERKRESARARVCVCVCVCDCVWVGLHTHITSAVPHGGGCRGRTRREDWAGINDQAASGHGTWTTFLLLTGLPSPMRRRNDYCQSTATNQPQTSSSSPSKALGSKKALGSAAYTLAPLPKPLYHLLRSTFSPGLAPSPKLDGVPSGGAPSPQIGGRPIIFG